MREVAKASVNIRTCTTWNLRLIYCRYLGALVFGPPGADIICFKKCSRQRGPPTTVLPILHGSSRRRSPTRLWPTVASPPPPPPLLLLRPRERSSFLPSFLPVARYRLTATHSRSTFAKATRRSPKRFSTRM